MDPIITRNKFNICLFGDTSVGKTSIANIKTGRPFEERTLTTIGLETSIDTINFDGKDYNFKIFDTAGQERFRSISVSNIHYSNGFMLIFAVDNEESFKRIPVWIRIISDEINLNDKVLYLVGNKIDKNNRVVSNEAAINFAKEHHMKYYETSAKSGYGINELFTSMYKDIYDKYLAEIQKNEKEGIENEKPSIYIGHGFHKKHHKKDKKCC